VTSTLGIIVNRNLILGALLSALNPIAAIGSDRGPPVVEVDKRDEAALLQAVQPEMLVGTWYSFIEGLASTQITMTDVLELGCKSPYTVVQKSVGKSYPDRAPSLDTGRTELEVGRFVTIKVKVHPRKCRNLTMSGFYQFSFMTTSPDYSFAAVVQYDENNRMSASYDLIKRD
jgi:hypothetical protein